MKFFRTTKFIHLPISMAGYLIWFIGLAFLITVFISIDKGSHSVSDTIYGIFPFFASVFLLIEWFTSKTSD